MISKEVFIDCIKSYERGLEFLRNMDKMGLDLYETPLCYASDTVFDMWLKVITDEEGSDLIYWWLFEDVEKKIYEDDKVIADLKDEEALYIYMKENGHFETEGNS